MWKRTLASVVFASSLFACSDRVIAIPAPTSIASPVPGGMTVTGTATLDVSPDCADITMTIDVDGARPGLATTGAQGKQQAIVDALKKVGLEAADIKLSTLTLNPVYEWIGNHNVFKGYHAAITITATTKHFDKIGPIMEAGSQSGATAMTTQFRRSDLSELKKKVRAMALTAAKDKAMQTATALDIKLGRVVNVAENAGGMMWTNAYFPQVANAMEVNVAPRTVADALGGALQPLTLDVTIVYELARET
jgi:uncharacterized protein YggE